MARAKKDKVDYFPHMVTGGKTIFILEQKFGNDGYAFWFKLLELLGDTKGHYFCTSNYADWHFLLAKSRVSEQTATEILDTLADLDAIDKELWKEKTIWVQKFVDNISDVYTKRKQEIPIKPNYCSRNDGSSVITVPEMQQSKVKESRVEESKVKDSREADASTIQQLSNLWTQCGYGTLNGNTVDKLIADIEIYSLPWVIEAIEIGNTRGKRSYAYVKGVLNKKQVEGEVDKSEPGRENKSDSEKPRRKYGRQRTEEELDAIDVNDPSII